ncbi:hypothetical protein Tco_1529002, partial [Tanacetum coccineum]
MAALESCPKHNMVAYLEKTEGNAEFHAIIDFLIRSSIHYALTVSPVASTTFIEQFWTSAKSIKTTSEASIRRDLLFDDADGIDVLNNQDIFNNIQLMGPTPTIPDSCPQGAGGNVGDQSSNDRSLSGSEDGLTLQSLHDQSSQGLASFEDLLNGAMDYQRTEEVKDKDSTDLHQ